MKVKIKNYLALLLAIIMLFFGYYFYIEYKEASAIKLGFISYAEMEEVKSMGMNSKKEYEEWKLNQIIKFYNCADKAQLEEARRVIRSDNCRNLQEHNRKLEIERMERERKNFELRLKAGITYRHSIMSELCSGNEKNKCINDEDFEKFCNKSNGVTLLGQKSLTGFGGRMDYLLKNGDLESIDIYWNERYEPQYRCRIKLVASGIFMGSSARESIEGAVEGFIVNESKEILVHLATDRR
jgi:hypothetical protein